VNVVVDTTIWSLALRRRAHQLSAEEKRFVEEWAALVDSGRAALVAPYTRKYCRAFAVRRFSRLSMKG